MMKDSRILIVNANRLHRRKIPEHRNFIKNEDHDKIIIAERHKVNNDKPPNIGEYKCEYKIRLGH